MSGVTFHSAFDRKKCWMLLNSRWEVGVALPKPRLKYTQCSSVLVKTGLDCLTYTSDAWELNNWKREDFLGCFTTMSVKDKLSMRHCKKFKLTWYDLVFAVSVCCNARWFEITKSFCLCAERGPKSSGAKLVLNIACFWKKKKFLQKLAKSSQKIY